MTSPTRTADLTGITLAHRVMRTDLHRLTATARAIAGGEPCPDRRARALHRWLTRLGQEIHGHHTAEDEIAWPVIARHAGHAVDLDELTDDHDRLDPLLDAVGAAADGLVAATGAGRAAAAATLADRLAVVRDEIDEHLDAEERDLFPVIERHVPAEDWDAVVAQVRTSGPGMRYMLPRIVEATTPQEWAAMRREAGPVLVVLERLTRRGHRRRSALVFGT